MLLFTMRGVFMKINGKEIDISNLINEINNDSSMLKSRGNGIYLSDDEVNILRRYKIDYERYNSLSSLIFEIEEILNNETDVDDLEEVSARLTEMNYYNNTNK